jgi:hypothetical protein
VRRGAQPLDATGGSTRRPLPFAFARVAGWLIVPLYLAGVCANLWFESRLGLQDEDPFQGVVLLVGFGAFAVVGALVVSKRPANSIGWILAAVAFMVAVFPAGDSYAAYVMRTRGRPDALAGLGAWAQGWYWYLLITLVFVYLPLLFPDGRLPSRRWLWVAVPPGIGTLAIVVLGALTDTLTGQNVRYRIENPIGIEGLAPVEQLPIFGALGVLLGVGILGAVASVAVRFRRSQGTERQQMKWFLYPASFLWMFFVIDYLPGIVGNLFFAAVVIGQPTAIGIAVLRHRLYEIDLIINRTLVYGSLTATLALFYFGGVTSVQAVFRALTGQEQQPQLAVVVSTLAIAALFNPLRRRIQAFIDRRFYRSKYDATKTLEAFSAKVRDETDIEALGVELVGVARRTVQPAHASLWLRPDPGTEARSAALRQFGNAE